MTRPVTRGRTLRHRARQSLEVPGGQPLTVPVQLGMALDGDRLVSLTATDPTGAGEDPAAFGELLRQAYDHQHTALD